MVSEIAKREGAGARRQPSRGVHLVLDKSFLPGSGGAGKYRGGLGQRVEMEITADRPVTLVVLSQRLNFPPVGRNGGANGSLERILVNGGEVEGGLPFRLNQGDVIKVDTRDGSYADRVRKA